MELRDGGLLDWVEASVGLAGEVEIAGGGPWTRMQGRGNMLAVLEEEKVG